MTSSIEVSVNGAQSRRRAIALHGVTVVCSGGPVHVGEIFDEYWLELASLPPPRDLVETLRARPDRPDVFTFAQRVPDTEPHFEFWREMDNFAVVPIESYDQWFNSQISSATRRNIRAAAKRGIEIRESEFAEPYVRGIMGIYNETPLRAGRKFWHYGKPFEAVYDENGTYAARSTFLGAYHGNEMVGYLKLVWDVKTAAIMQVLSKLAYRDSRPNNGLIAEAVRLCAARGVKHLLYEKFDYGNKRGDSLTVFKQNNGFIRMDVPRYFVPLTLKGRAALRLGLHRRMIDRVPDAWVAPLRELRTRWYARRLAAAAEK